MVHPPVADTRALSVRLVGAPVVRAKSVAVCQCVQVHALSDVMKNLKRPRGSLLCEWFATSTSPRGEVRSLAGVLGIWESAVCHARKV